MSNTQVFSAFLMVFALSAPSMGAEAPPVFTLDKALNAALAGNASVKAAREQLNEADAKVSAAWSSFFPNVSASVAGYYRKDALTAPIVLFGGDPYNNYQIGLTAIQPLFTAGQASGSLGVAHQNREIARTQLEIAERDLGAQVIQAFYGTLLQQRQIDTWESQRATQEELLVTAQRHFQQGTGKRLEVLQMKASLAQIEPKLEKAHNDLKVRAAELAQLMGGIDTNAIAVQGSLDPIDWKKLLEQAKGSHGIGLPEMRLADAKAELADSNKTMTMGKHYPQLSARGDLSKNTYQKVDLLDPATTAWALSLQLQIPLFSGLSSFQERKALNSEIEQAEINRTQVRDNAAINQIRTAKDFESAQAVYQSASRALEISHDAWDEASRTYRLGTIPYTQLFDSQKTLTDAEFAYDQAKFDTISAATKYFVAMGWDMKSLVSELSAQRPQPAEPVSKSARAKKKR